MRGGGLVDKPLGTQATRYYFVNLAYSTLAALNGLPNAFAYGPDQFLRVAIRGWADWMDMGDNKKDEVLIKDLINMTERGMYQTRGAEDLVRSTSSFSTDGFAAAGLQMGPCYLTVWDKFKGVYVLKDPPLPFRGYIDWPTAWGEYCFGAVLGYGMSSTALYSSH